ncbi:hypothetical protein HAX54_000794 [Datura stramonium]|uniref:Uncharacterized protein n=1 Tax=Datura stramonium TaxID=4076 RepID=A0ABS8WV49_DATST|nr:hypothetical protein [Datura stramonium]
METENIETSVEIKGIPTRDGKYVEYNVVGNFFEVTSNCATNSETKEGDSNQKLGMHLKIELMQRGLSSRDQTSFPHGSHVENIIKRYMRPPDREEFKDVYIVYELMDTDLHQIIRSSQALTEDHCQVHTLLLSYPNYPFQGSRRVKPTFLIGFTFAVQASHCIEAIGLDLRMLYAAFLQGVTMLGKYVKQLPRVPKQPFSQHFPDSLKPFDLAERMLVFIQLNG